MEAPEDAEDAEVTEAADASDVGKFLYLRVQYRDGHNTEDDPTTEIEVLDERDDGVNNTAPTRIASCLLGRSMRCKLSPVQT